MNITSHNSIANPIIMIVDDNIKNLELAVTLLQLYKYEIAVANSGKEAIEILNEVTPDLILLDIMMPEMDGYEVCKTIKSNPKYKNIPVLFLTAKSETEDIVKGFEAGGVDFIKKPFKQEELLIRIKNHLELKRASDIILSQNQEKNALLSITAHDLKNPLQAILGLMDILERQHNNLSPDDFIEIVRAIKYSTKTAIHITKDLLDVHAFEEGKIFIKNSVFNIYDVINDIIDNYKFSASDKHINIHFNSDCSSYLINADKSKTERIFDNLISNAIKFTNKNKNIWINIYSKHNTQSNLEQVITVIKDEGPGLTDEDKKNLFKKFAKLSAKPTGGETSSGLGLSIVKKLVEAMNGSVWCESIHGSGASFFVAFDKYLSDI